MPLASQFLDEIERPQGGNVLLWLVEIELQKAADGIPPTLFRGIVGRQAETEWPLSAPLTTTWYPFNFTFDQIEQTTDGDLAQLALTFDNTARTLMRFLHDGQGLEGNRCTIYLVPATALGVAYPSHVYKKWDFQIAYASATMEAITFRLEFANFNNVRTPADRFNPWNCRWGYGSDECGYVLNALAGYATCPKTITACVQRGLDHRARGLPVVHPARYGGFPALAAQR